MTNLGKRDQRQTGALDGPGTAGERAVGPAHIARMLGVSRSTIFREYKDDRMPHIVVRGRVRFFPSEVLRAYRDRALDRRGKR